MFSLRTYIKLFSIKKIILASVSPRRKEIFGKLKLPFETKQSGYRKNANPKMPPGARAEFLSAGKARMIAKKHHDAIIIGADTFIIFKNRILGKLKTARRAREMLKMLSGKKHEVTTGVAIIDTGNNITISFHETTKIFMQKFSPEIIDRYIKTGEPLDKAGAYALQEIGALLIEKIEGDFFNAMGLPLSRLAKKLKNSA